MHLSLKNECPVGTRFFALFVLDDVRHIFNCIYALEIYDIHRTSCGFRTLNQEF